MTHLWLDNNDFGADKESLGSLQQLLSRIAPNIEELSLCSNQLEKNSDGAIDSFLGLTFQRLLVLRLRNNFLRQWPSSRSGGINPMNVKWDMLVDIDMSNNKLASIPTNVLRSLPSLTHANFSKNEIVSLPSEPKRGSQQAQGGPVWPSTLVSLDISKNRMKKMPGSFGAAGQSLTHLDVSHNSIKSLPPTLFNLKTKSLGNLQHLLLQHNALSGDDALPMNLPMSLSQSCRKLDLSSNALTALPSQLGLMFQLRELNASHNEISAFPSGAATKFGGGGGGSGSGAPSKSSGSQFLPHLKILHLEFNRLTVLPNSFGSVLSSPSIQQCFLQNNSLVALPEMEENKRTSNNPATGFVPGLLSLDVTHNKIVQLSRTIGEALGPTLLSLRIAHNRLETVPIAAFSKFQKLQDLTCHGNPIM